MKALSRALSCCALLSVAGLGAVAAEREPIECEMSYTLSGWSAFYKTAKGKGTITCDNGQSAKVTLDVKGGGITFGKSVIDDGRGNFSDVYDIGELFGSYAAAEAHAGAVKSAQAAVYTRGEVSLAMTGKGRGFNVGIDFGKITIEPK